MLSSLAIQSELITGGTFTAVAGDYHLHVADSTLKDAQDFLLRNIAPGAFHNSEERYDAPKCHPNTRRAIIKKIMNWAQNEAESYPLLWVYGPAGSGKSSIAQTMAEMLSSSSLAASFFFGRTAPGRNDSSRLIATLAYQLTVSIPSIRDHVLDQLTRDPAIFKRSMDAQMQNLILEPLVTARTNSQQDCLLPRLVVIDGLDECGDGKAQRQILSVFFSAVHHSGLPLSFLIFSRPEHDIRIFFNQDAACSASRRITFDNEYRNNKDVETFLRSKFADIRVFHPAGQDLPPDWPSDSDIRRLVSKASGQFAFASTVTRYVESRRHLPAERLNILFGLSPHDNGLPFAELDALYVQLFTTAEDRDKVYLVFAYILWDCESSQTEYLEGVLLLQKGELQIILQDFYSVLKMPPPGQPLDRVSILHSSFYDFLTDRSRSKEVFISEAEGHARLASCYIKHIKKHISSPYDPGWDPMANYQAYYKILTHLSGSCLTDELLNDLQEFPLNLYLNNMFEHEEEVYGEVFLGELPSLFDWIESQATPGDRKRLHVQYLRYLDAFLLRCLSQHPVGHASSYLMTASTLDNFSVHLDSMSLVIAWDDDTIARTAAREHVDEHHSHKCLFKLPRDPYMEGFHHMTTSFLKDPKRSGTYHVDASKYLALSKLFIEHLNGPGPTLYQDFRDKPIDTDLRKMELCCLDLLLSCLALIPHNHDFATYLRNNPIPSHSKRCVNPEELALRQSVLQGIETYIKAVDATMERVPTPPISHENPVSLWLKSFRPFFR